MGIKVDGLQRTVPAAETFTRVKDVADLWGVRRLADITGLDRIGIPVYTAVVPKSDDGISIYTGKGCRPVDAKVGALMEAIERQVALKVRLPIVEGSYLELQKHRNILDPKAVSGALRHDYSDACMYSWIHGVELILREPILVPAKCAGYFWSDVPHSNCYEISCSNGLASGNCLEEAICQALCELIERDSWTIAELGAHALPWARRRFVNRGLNCEGPDDFELLSCVRLEDDPVLDLFHQAGLYPVIHDITSDLKIPTVFVAVADELTPDFPMVHCGVGAHPDARVALRRALTEAAQSRCVDIQGVREDIIPANAAPAEFDFHTRRVSCVNRKMWFLGQSKKQVELSDLPSVENDDIRQDLEHILSRLISCGISQVIVVDFTPPGSPFVVVRVIVPGLESWAVNRGRVGKRALEYWRTHV